MSLTKNQRAKLTKKSTWTRQRQILNAAELLLKELGTKVYMDFNQFENEARKTLKEHDVKLGAPERRILFNGLTWYDPEAEKVIKKRTKLTGKKLEKLLGHLNCTKEELTDFGYYPTEKEGMYVVYDTATDLRDTENVPLKEEIHDYFLREVKPHVEEAWIDLDKTKIGYEISFNKYFYRHKPLRDIEEVAEDILELEEKSEGLIHEIIQLA